MTEMELCQCGREKGPRAHCPVCGTTKCYPLLRQTDTVTRPDGSKADLRVWRCTRCTHRFNDDDWRLRCQAPPERWGRRKRQVAPVQPEAVDDTPAGLRDPAVDAVLRQFYADLRAKEQEQQRKTPQQIFDSAKGSSNQ